MPNRAWCVEISGKNSNKTYMVSANDYPAAAWLACIEHAKQRQNVWLNDEISMKVTRIKDTELNEWEKKGQRVLKRNR